MNKKTIILTVFLFLLLPPSMTSLTYLTHYRGQIYPGVVVAQNHLGGKTPKEAVQLLQNNVSLPQKIALKINTTTGVESFNLPLNDTVASYDFDKTVQKAYRIGRGGNIVNDAAEIFSLFQNPRSLNLELDLMDDKLDSYLSVIAEGVYIEPSFPNITVSGSSIVVDKGKLGEEINRQEALVKIKQKLSTQDTSAVALSTFPIGNTLNESEVKKERTKLAGLIGKALILTFEDKSFNYQGTELIHFATNYHGAVMPYMLSVQNSLKLEIEREPQNPAFIYKDGKVQEFAPAKDGITLSQTLLEVEIDDAINKLLKEDINEIEIEIPISKTKPEFQTADVNNLGIKELIGRGVSRFKGSISSRIYNISLAANRLNGILIKPEKIFSFNKALGDISKFTGYKEAYIIKDGKTVLGDGGGVCQVSTTFFRAALDAGLPIVERRGHSYRVSYYEQDSSPGIDATVYEPTTDLKIKNDTPAHILIQAKVNVRYATLTFEFYGTGDGRVSTITKPIVTDITPPPEDLYIDDPALPAGEIKQIDYKAWGAKARFNYSVTRGVEVIYKKTFYSNYRPWQAKFLRGTGPVQ